MSSPLNSLPNTTTYLTGHDESGKAIVHSTRPAQWSTFDDKKMGFNVVFTDTFPADLTANQDIAAHDSTMSSGKLGLVKKDGVVCRTVDFAPLYTGIMHRTQSLDFGIVVEGSVEMLLDDGSTTLLQRGDVAVQRATMHAWRNPSETEWTRMVFVLQDCKAFEIGGKKMGEDLGGELPKVDGGGEFMVSGNDK